MKVSFKNTGSSALTLYYTGLDSAEMGGEFNEADKDFNQLVTTIAAGKAHTLKSFHHQGFKLVSEDSKKRVKVAVATKEGSANPDEYGVHKYGIVIKNIAYEKDAEAIELDKGGGKAGFQWLHSGEVSFDSTDNDHPFNLADAKKKAFLTVTLHEPKDEL